jgi:serine/threonine protein kinase
MYLAERKYDAIEVPGLRIGDDIFSELPSKALQEISNISFLPLTYAIDVWALGVLVYGMYSATSLIKSNTILGTMSEINSICKDFSSTYGSKIKDPLVQKPIDMFNNPLVQNIKPLLLECLKCDSDKRIKAADILDDPFFSKAGVGCKRDAKIEYPPYNFDWTTFWSPEEREKDIENIKLKCFNIYSTYQIRLQLDESDLSDIRFLAIDIFDRSISKNIGDAIYLNSILHAKSTNYDVYLWCCAKMAFEVLTQQPITYYPYVSFENMLADKYVMRILQDLDFKIFRPSLKAMFPKANEQHLLECYTKHPAPFGVKDL